jgi:DNA adenine methylase
MTEKKTDIELLNNQFKLFPGTRYMGSKNRIIQEIGEILIDYEFSSFYDAFAGSNVVGYLFKTLGKRVITNDFMSLSHTISKAIIENSRQTISKDDLDFLLNTPSNQKFISKKFKGLYFEDSDNLFLDQIRDNIDKLDSDHKRAVALSALTRACMKKRPRGIFTFVGHRYDDGRQDIKLSLKEHFLLNIDLFNNAVFDNECECKSYNGPTESLKVVADLVYLDPPYFTPNSDNDYVRRYHFVEGLVKNWEGIELQEHTKTKKFKSYSSPFSKKTETYLAFEKMIEKFQNSIIAISYSSNSKPDKEELVAMLAKYKTNVIVHEIDHLYSFGNQNHKVGNNANRVKEYFFVAH